MARGRRGRAPDGLAEVGLLIASTLIALSAGEFLVRVTNGARYAERPAFYPRDEQLGWRPAPGLDDVYYGGDFAISVATDDFGARLGTLGPVPPVARRIILLGDSYTFGWGVGTSETYASRLDELVASSARGARVVNLGVSGYGTVQSAERLDRYIAGVQGGPVVALVLLHSHNDPADNVRHEAVRRDLREYVEAPRNRGFHLHNLVRLGLLALRSERADGTLPGGHRDFLFAVEASRTAAGRGVVGRADADRGSDEELLWEGQEVLPTYERESLTGLQTELLERSIARIHDMASRLGAPVYHVAIHSAPEWYLRPVRSIVLSATPAVPVHWCGRVRAEEQFSGPFENDHSGSHFTPELNAFYARTIAEWLERGACP